MKSYDLVIALFNVSLSPVTVDPSSALRGAGVDEWASGNAANGSGGSSKGRGPLARPCGVQRVAEGHVEGAFEYCVHVSRIQLQRHNQTGRMTTTGTHLHGAKATSTSSAKQRPT